MMNKGTKWSIWTEKIVKSAKVPKVPKQIFKSAKVQKVQSKFLNKPATSRESDIDKDKKSR